MRFYFLDGLRCLAVLAVMFQHYAESCFKVAAQPILSLGPGVFGVALFFMISGFVIPLSFKPGDDWRSFAMRRLFRIMPMYWLMLVFVITLGQLGIEPYHAMLSSMDFPALLSNALLIFEYARDPALIGVAWSLSLEFVWYGIFCLLICFGGQNNCHVACLGYSFVLILCCILSVAIDQRFPFGRLLMLNAALLGYAQYLFVSGGLDRRVFLKIQTAFICAGLLSLWVGFDLFEHPTVSFTSNIYAWSAAYFIFTISCNTRLIRNSSAFRSPKIGYIGLWSYSIYLLHTPILNLMATQLDGITLSVVATILTLGYAAVTYRFVERPGVLLGKSFTRTRLQNQS